jgi:hypothetical protein
MGDCGGYLRNNLWSRIFNLELRKRKIGTGYGWRVFNGWSLLFC